MEEKINRYWLLNLWEAIDGETVEINRNPDDYINLDISKDKDQDLITNDLLVPQLNFFQIEDQKKIQKSMLYAINHLSEEDLLECLNSFGGTVFPTPNSKITIRKFYIDIYNKLFKSQQTIDISKVSDINDKNIFRDFNTI